MSSRKLEYHSRNLVKMSVKPSRNRPTGKAFIAKTVDTTNVEFGEVVGLRNMA
jgi:hypothetical protein